MKTLGIKEFPKATSIHISGFQKPQQTLEEICKKTAKLSTPEVLETHLYGYYRLSVPILPSLAAF
jgi:hypothetical protein